MGPLNWRALGDALGALGVAGVPTGREGLCELRLGVCGEGNVLRVLLHECRRLDGGEGGGGGGNEAKAGSLSCFGVPIISQAEDAGQPVG
eukprot:3043243-Prymnesium_polylepis.1